MGVGKLEMGVYDSYRINDWERMLKPDRYPTLFTPKPPP